MWIQPALILVVTSLLPQSVRIGNVPTIPNGILNPPALIASPAAEYTEKALQLGIQGNVIVEAAFDIDGNFSVLRIVQALGYGLDENALAALKQWQFTPAYRNGDRVPVIARIEIPFRTPDSDLYWSATDKIDQGDFEAAMLMLQKLINSYPDSPFAHSAHFDFGKALLLLKDKMGR
jgi:TonB family protein